MEVNWPLLGNTPKCLKKREVAGMGRCRGPPSSTRVALELPLLSLVSTGAAGLKRALSLPPRLPDTWSSRQTQGEGASDSVPDLPGSPHLWLMDDPPLLPTLPLPSECCCLQGHCLLAVGTEKAGRSGWRAFPPSFHPAALPVTLRSPDSPTGPGWPGVPRCSEPSLPPLLKGIKARQPEARRGAGCLSPEM